MPLRNRNRNTIPAYRVGGTGAFVGLLDTYGGAAAAYSVRRLSSTYEGSAMEVRVDTVGQPVYDIGFDSNGDLDTADLISKAAGNDAFVRTWYDQSGNANNAQQTTTSAQPQIVSSGSINLLNGKPCLDLDGSNDFLNCGSSFSKPSNYTTFSVFRTDAVDNQVLFGDANSGASSSSTGMFCYLFDNKFMTNFGDGSNFSRPISTETYSISTDYLYVSNYIDGNNLSSMRLNSSDLTVTQLGGSATSIGGTASNFSIGRFGEFNGVYLNGKINEMVFYTSDNSSNISGIESNINTYFSIY